ncbi:Csu type fimbrial protein [Anaeromyxobacter terrae]|uniref:Csu type fimbrial protein n=1 Tax=Anaeromyxobacter terrae TaxID=2925406 RepID=UPI001F5941BC|nr:spore coat U domain-containing protein [Anaeromyxobacter sp. SG22]
MNRTALRLSLALAAVLSSTAARAGTATATINVSAQVPQSCKITSSSDIAFGAYDPVVTHASAAKTATGSVTLQCTKGTTYDLKLGLGSNAAGSQRQLKSPTTSAVLSYDLYSDTASPATPWNETTYVTKTAANMSPATLTIYAEIPAGQPTAEVAADYADSVTATLNF